MRTCAVIAEYNPFHNGHLHHIRKTREITGAENLAAIMSGNFVQRGEPAIRDKFARERMALQNGVDLVIELPVYYAAQSAGYFAGGAVALAEKSGICDSISFGSETGDLAGLKLAAGKPEESGALKSSLKAGKSFARALGEAAGLPLNPNDVLAVEYLRAVKTLVPFAVKRTAEHNAGEISGGFSSAAAIRRAFRKSPESAAPAMPEDCFALLKNGPANRLENYFGILSFILASKTAAELREIQGVGEGLENRLAGLIPGAGCMESFIAAVKTKRYAFASIQRVILHIILDMKKREAALYKNAPRYIRVLGFRREKAGLLRELTEKSALPVITNLKNAPKLLDPDAMAMLKFEISCGDIYNLGLGVTGRPLKNHEYSEPMVIV